MATSPSTHVIRLRGPWEHDFVPPLADWNSSELSSTSSHSAPPHVPFPEWPRFRRAFGLPTGLSTADRVDLVISGCGGPGRVWLNDVLLGDISTTGGASRLPIRDALQQRNRLVFVFLPRRSLADPDATCSKVATTPTAMLGEVNLEIHSAQLTG